MPTPRPSVTLVFAQSLDGRIAVRGAPERAVFSTPEGLDLAHRARAEHDAVLVGIGTVVADDPRLTARGHGGPQPLRVVLDSALALSPAARVLAQPGAPAVVFAAQGRAPDDRRAALERASAHVSVVPPDARGRVSLPHALAALWARGVRSLLVEGGAAVLTSFLLESLADRVQIEVAPCLLGASGLAATGELGVSALARAITLDDVTVDRAGLNVLVRGRVRYPA